ncbi:hypothetical protein [Halorientalis salina]|uniref:hypothetical protein n=1 Tax=Halorientalis salina TaxID=2932266 RepID=UPI0010AD2DFA|nr:hypothetical protein [Halorientalis salina]
MDLDRSRLFLVLGTVLLLGSAWGGYQVWDVDYTHSLRDDEDVTFNASRMGHVSYENLSDHDQQVIDRTITRGKYTVETEDATVSRFTYTTDSSHLGSGWYVVQRHGQNYTILTHKNTPGLSGVLFTPVLFAVGIVGLLLCILGILFRDPSDRE